MASTPLKRFRESDRVIKIAAGEPFEYGLPAGAGGYYWEARNMPDVVRLIDDRKYEQSSKNTGAQAEQVLRFEAVKPGSGELQLVCRTSSNQGNKPPLVIQISVV